MDIEITVVRADTNKPFDVTLPDDADVSGLLPELVREIGMPRLDAEGSLASQDGHRPTSSVSH